MSAYYNEHDPFAAAWLRELIKDGHIADGEVDERDIQAIDPDDLRGFTQCHFFAGIGGWSVALRLAGWPDDRPVWTGSCPCQPFSSAGKRQGGADDRHLWPYWARLIEQCRPPVILGEQVESAVAHGWLDAVCDDLEGWAYACGAAVLPAASVGAFHIRQRIWFVADAEHAERWPQCEHGSDGRHGPDCGRTEAHGEPGTCGEVCGLAQSECAERRQGRAGCERAHGGGAYVEPTGPGDVGGLADAGSEGAARHAGEDGGPRGQSRAELHDGGEAGGLGDTSGSRLPQRGSGGRVQHEAMGPHERQAVKRSRGDASPWADVIWHACRDGKARPIPAQSCVQSVVDGLSGELVPSRTPSDAFPLAESVPNRVGMLRGAGNAIVPAMAAAFISAYQDVTA